VQGETRVVVVQIDLVEVCVVAVLYEILGAFDGTDVAIEVFLDDLALVLVPSLLLLLLLIFRQLGRVILSFVSRLLFFRNLFFRCLCLL